MKQFTTWKGTAVRLCIIMSCITGKGNPYAGGGLWNMGKRDMFHLFSFGHYQQIRNDGGESYTVKKSVTQS